MQTLITTETTDRTTADTALQTNITAEETARAEADTLLQNAINTEITARAEGDTALQAQIDTFALGGGEDVDVFYITDGNIDIDCSTIPPEYNALQITLHTFEPAIKIYNIENSNIRYITSIQPKTFAISLAKGYASIRDFVCLVNFYALGVESTPIFTAYIPVGSAWTVSGWGSLHLIKQRNALFFIRFNSDLTYITEYFNTDEFLIPFDSAGTHDPKKWIYINQPTTVVAGLELMQTSIYYSEIVSPLATNYLLHAPIHSPCIGVFEGGSAKNSLVYVQSETIYGKDAIYM